MWNFDDSKAFDSSKDLSLYDITFTSDSSKYKIHLKPSKADVFRSSVHIPVFAAGLAICPGSHMKRYYRLRLLSGARDNDPLFVLENGAVLDRSTFITSVR